MPKDAVETTAEGRRLAEAPSDGDPWRLWGPYLSARQWGTVREDYSADGRPWRYFPFDHAHLRTYRWGEDGIAGLCDRYGFLNLAVALWNGHDDRLKERLFGLTNDQGNHGEDVKEYWWDLDATPTHSYAAMLYRYPQAAFPYADLVAENGRRGRADREYELVDTGVLDENRFFDVVVTHAKAAPDDVCVRIEATNQGPDAAPLDIVPQLWFRNTWSWGRDDRVATMSELRPPEWGMAGQVVLEADHGYLGRYRLFAQGRPEVLFCDNETDEVAVFGAERNSHPHPKSAVDRAIVHGDPSLLNPGRTGTKAALRYHFDAVAPGQTVVVNLRLADEPLAGPMFGEVFERILTDRRAESDEFYRAVIPASVTPEDFHVARRAFAGLLWGRRLYRYGVTDWLQGDPATPPPPASRLEGRNHDWRNLYLADVISLPDAWEYPWFAAWDLAFHCAALAHVDPAFAKSQLILLCREWAQHPDGQLPAYEWALSDVNPPVHAWAAWRVYALDGATDHEFLVRVFSKLLLNFGWWVNRKDEDGSGLFEGGFLGMDNIGLFDRSKEVPDGFLLEQSDATSWMAFYCLSMLRIALELSRRDSSWDDLATTFLERFVALAVAMDAFGPAKQSVWDEEDGFFYDVLVNVQERSSQQLRVRSLVGLLPMLAVALAPEWVGQELHDFTERLRWVQRKWATASSDLMQFTGLGGEHLTLALVRPDRYARLLAHMLDEDEFLSPHGVRSLSAAYRGGQTIDVVGTQMSIAYDPAESTLPLFGGNSNWRGPVWMPINMLLVDSLRVYAEGAGRDLRVELPTGSGHRVPLGHVAGEIEHRLIGLFRRGPDGRRPGAPRDHRSGPLWDDHITFSEYFDGDTGEGLGASHQTGWTALVAHMICTTYGQPNASSPSVPEEVPQKHTSEREEHPVTE